MSCGLSDAAKELTDKLDEIDQKIEDTLNSIPGIEEAQKFADELEGELNTLKDKVLANVPILGSGSLPPELQSLQSDVETAIGYVMMGVNGVNEVKGQMDYIKGKWGDVDLGDIKSIDDLSDMITSGAADLDNLCTAVTNAIPTPAPDKEYEIKAGDTLSQIAADNGLTVEEIMKKNPKITDPDKIQAGATITIPGKFDPANITIEATPISLPPIDVLGVMLGDPFPKVNPPRLILTIEGPQKAASNIFNDVVINRFDP